MLIKKKTDTIISISDVGPNHPMRMKKILKNGRLANIYSHLKKENMQPIQNLEKIYIRNGAIYISKNVISKLRSIVGKKIYPYIMPFEKSINIDTEDDLILAKYKIKKQF